MNRNNPFAERSRQSSNLNNVLLQKKSNNRMNEDNPLI